MEEINTPLCDLFVNTSALDYDDMFGHIYKCKPKNMPEDFNFDLNLPFIIGDTFEEMFIDYSLTMSYESHRFCFRKNKTWCGEHPKYWRKMTQREALKWLNLYINSKKNKKK